MRRLALIWPRHQVLYLIRASGSCRWVGKLEGGALPLAVAFQKWGRMTVAPVHPLCHLETATQLRLGTESFDVAIHPQAWQRYVRYAMVITIITATFFGGWFLQRHIHSSSIATVHTTEDMYTF